MKRAMLTAALLAGSVITAQAAPRMTDPDWPCQQVKVPELSVAALWTGPSIDPYRMTWKQDPAIAELAAKVAQRRMPIDKARTKIDDFAQQAGADRQTKLLMLFAGLFQTLDDQRASVIAGLRRFGARQKELAANLHADEDALRAAQSADPPDEAKLSDLTQRLKWDGQVFEQRHQALSYACEVPDKIEQRLFALSRVIQPLLN